MYWFNIFYYDNSPAQYVIPLTNNEDAILAIYAATPQQATEAAWQIINNNYDDYSYHIMSIGTLSSCIDMEEADRWDQDHNQPY